MSKVGELQKRIEYLEAEVELLKELVKLHNKIPERSVPMYPPTPLNPYYSKEPTLEPPYKITC